MKYSTEDQQLGSIQVAPMGGVLNDFIPGAEEAVKTAATTVVWGGIGLLTLGLVLKVGPALKKNRLLNEQIEEQELRTATARINFDKARTSGTGKEKD